MSGPAELVRRFGRVLGLRGPDVSVGGPEAYGNSGGTAGEGQVAASSAVLHGEAKTVARLRRTEGVEFGGLRALVADDSEINRTILRTFLERLGFEVTLAKDGVEAISRWMPGGHDLICMDIEMPNLDGLSAFVRMKAEAARLGVAMPMSLAVTINAMSSEVTDYLRAGFDSCLPKPFSRNDLVDLLRRRWPADAA